jgi:hypothetical protein
MAPATPAAAAAAMVAAKNSTDKARIGAAVIAAAPPPSAVLERNKYSSDVVKAFEPLLDPKMDADTRLNAAIVIAAMETLATDRTLINMLESADASVRYYGAKGLGAIEGVEKMAGPGPAVTALRKAAAKEKSGVVLTEIIKALVLYGDFPALLEGLDKASNQMADAVPDVGALDAAARGLEAIAGATGSASAADKQLAASDAARLASFAAQQLGAAQKGADQGVSKDYIDATGRVIAAATRVINAATGGSFVVPSGSSADELLLNTGSLVGSPGGNPGKLQEKLPKVAVPPKVKAPQ